MAGRLDPSSVELDELQEIARKLKERANASFATGLVFVATAAFIALGLISGFGLYGVSRVEGAASTGIKTGESLLYLLLPFLPQLLSVAGAIFLSIYLIQLVVSFARYYFKLTDHLHACRFAMLMAQFDAQQFIELMATISPINIAFGKMPEPLPHKVVSALSDLAKSLRG